jgi:hypothetical protein
MSGSGWMPLVVGLIAASVALTGYVMTQAANRRRQKAKLFAEAIEAVKAFEEVPYRIAKRAASGGPTRADLGNRVSDLFVKLGLYRAWLQIESPLAGEAYVLLLDRTHEEVAPHREAAWARPVHERDAAPADQEGGRPLRRDPRASAVLDPGGAVRRGVASRAALTVAVRLGEGLDGRGRHQAAHGRRKLRVQRDERVRLQLRQGDVLRGERVRPVQAVGDRPGDALQNAVAEQPDAQAADVVEDAVRLLPVHLSRAYGLVEVREELGAQQGGRHEPMLAGDDEPVAGQPERNVRPDHKSGHGGILPSGYDAPA